MARDVHHAAGDVGAVVGGALQTGQQIRPDEARLGAAFAFGHAQDVARAQLLLQRVDHLLQRLDPGGQLRVVFVEGAEGQRQNLLHRAHEHVHLPRGLG